MSGAGIIVSVTEPPALEPSATKLRLVVVTGMSGAGRSTAANTLEDLGWYVVDNLPPSVLPEVCTQASEVGLTRLAVVLDVRTREFFEQLPAMFSDLSAAGALPEILYLEASDDVIVRRQESVRRPHPLQGDGRLLDGITRERETLATLRAAADLVIDTSSLNVHQLASRVTHAYGGETEDRLRVTLIPLDSRTAYRSMPTWSSTSGSCRIRTGSPSYARKPASANR